MKQIKIFLKLLLIIVTSIGVVSCQKEDIDEETPSFRHTVIVLMPWADNLTAAFQQNIRDMEKAVREGHFRETRIVYARSMNEQSTEIVEMYPTNGQCVKNTLATFTDTPYTSSYSIENLLRYIVNSSNTPEYSMIVGGHGLGWLPVTATTGQSRRAFYHYERTDVYQTRWIGGLTTNHQMDVTTLADAIKMAGLHLNYILFDNCYMSSIEVAYDLREVTDYMIACPAEIMMYGFPYYKCLRYLTDQINYQAVCQEFLSFYSNYTVPSGTIAVTDCRELDELAAIIKAINGSEINPVLTSNIQIMDGYEPPIFYDFGDYIHHFCNNRELSEQFNSQMNVVVPYKAFTSTFYSALNGTHNISYFSGLTTSAPSRNSFAGEYVNTAWYKDTHNNQK